MAISTVAELRTAITNWTDRTDLAEARINEFIVLAEARIARRLRSRGVESRDTSITTVGGTEYYTLPTDFIEARNVQINVNPVRVLKYLTPQQMDAMFPGTTAGTATHFTIIGSQIQLAQVPSSADTLEIAYYKKLPALTDSATTNWLTTDAPDLLLYGALIEAEIYLENQEKSAMYAKMFDVAMQELNYQDDRGRHSGSALTIMNNTGNP